MPTKAQANQKKGKARRAPVPLDQIPGLQEAIAKACARANELRDLAFHEVTLEICGVEVEQLTLQHLSTLFACGSPFVCGGGIGPEHVAQFLWILSPRFSPDRKDRAEFVAGTLAKVRFGKGIKAIDAFLEDALFDRPPGAKGGGESIVSFVASYVDLIAEAYGWDDDAILRKPVARLYQYVRLIQRRKNPKIPVFNPARDKAVGDFLRRRKKGRK